MRTTKPILQSGSKHGAVALLVLFMALPSDALAYCTYKTTSFTSGMLFDKEIPVYVNDGMVSVARTGLPVNTVEQLVRSAIAAVNESGARLPRLVYAGRVQNDTVIRDSSGQTTDEYIAAWQAANPGRPTGIVVQAMPCVAVADGDENLGAIAEARIIKDSHLSTVSFTPYQDDQGKICPRSGKVVNCLGEAEPIPPGACVMGETEPCDCADGNTGEHQCDPAANGGASGFGACRCTGRGYEAYNIGDGAAVVGHGDCDDLQPQDVKDFQGVLMHELGHVLGLDHASITEASSCGGAINTDGPGETAGVMTRNPWVQQTGRGRRFRLDDMRGFDVVYDDANWPKQLPISYYESNDLGATWGSVHPLPGSHPGAAVRPSVSSAVDDGSGFMAVAWAASDGSIWHATRDAGGWHALKADKARLPDAIGASTRDPVAVAYGEGKLAIAWFLETTKDEHVEIRWAIRNSGPGGAFVWTTKDFTSHPEVNWPNRLIRKDIGLGYDLASHSFVLTAIRSVDFDTTNPDEEFPDPYDGRLWMASIDPQTADVRFHKNPLNTPMVHAISKPACHLASSDYFVLPGHCAVLATPMRSSGAVASAYYFAVAESGGFSDTLDDDLLLPSVGYSDLAVAPNTAVNQPFVGTATTQGGGGAETMVTFRTNADLGQGGPIYPPYGMASLDNANIAASPGTPPAPAPQPNWPTAVGSRLNGSNAIFTLVRAGAACGDGIKTQGEDCDDGNLENGDGCDDKCDIECTPGDVGCRCLDVDNPGEENFALPHDGIFGDGRYCHDDVSLGGQVRCLEENGESTCHACVSGQGVWCPCIPAEGCFPAALDGPVNGNPGDSGVCEAVCDPDFPDICDTSPAGSHGYCFVEGQGDPMLGGRPTWFLDQYCYNVHSQLSCSQQPGEARMCTVATEPQCN